MADATDLPESNDSPGLTDSFTDSVTDSFTASAHAAAVQAETTQASNSSPGSYVSLGDAFWADSTQLADGYVVQPAQAWPGLNLPELWQYKNFVYFLAWRDVKLQFKQTVLGAIWAVAQPLAMACIFWLVFGLIFNMQSGDVPYLLFFFSGLVPWNLFTQGLNACAHSIVSDSQLIQKVYCPRLVFPIAALGPPCIDALFAFAVLLVMLLVFGYLPSWTWLFAPVFLILAILAAFSVGIWFCALNVKYRDSRYLLPLTITLWMYMTPVFYPTSMIPERLQWIYALNPMVGVVEGLRWSLFQSNDVKWLVVAVSQVATWLSLIAGAFYFRRCEETFADEL